MRETALLEGFGALGIKRHLGAIISLSEKCFPAGDGGSPQPRFGGTTIIITITKQTAPGCGSRRNEMSTFGLLMDGGRLKMGKQRERRRFVKRSLLIAVCSARRLFLPQNKDLKGVPVKD